MGETKSCPLCGSRLDPVALELPIPLVQVQAGWRCPRCGWTAEKEHAPPTTSG